MSKKVWPILRDLLLVVVLCSLGGWLPGRFMDYKGEAIRDLHVAQINTYAPTGLVFATDTRTLDLTDTVMENGRMVAHPGSILIQNGFYAKKGVTATEAVLGGAGLPCLCFIGAAFFLARGRRQARALSKTQITPGK